MNSEDEVDPRTDRIIQVAMELAEEDGFDHVRLRELAARADVALGTVYRRFSSKEDILAAALERMVIHFREAVTVAPIPGDTALERLVLFLELATQTFAERPRLAAALLRTVACGEPAIAQRVLSYQDTMTEILIVVMRGEVRENPPSEGETLAAKLILSIWFGAMVGWTGGLHSVETGIDQVSSALPLLLRALESP